MDTEVLTDQKRRDQLDYLECLLVHRRKLLTTATEPSVLAAILDSIGDLEAERTRIAEAS